MSASEAKKNLRAYEDVRCSLCGDSFSIFSFAIMASMMSSELTPRMSPAQILQRLGLAPGCSAHPSVQVPITRWLSYGGDGGQPHSLQELCQHLGLSVNHTGADVKINSGLVLGGNTLPTVLLGLGGGNGSICLKFGGCSNPASIFWR